MSKCWLCNQVHDQMNLYRIAQILREYRDKDGDGLVYDVSISTDIENPTHDGIHTDDDSITLGMPNGDKWRIRMEKIS